jgi:hypothetical protein
MVWPESLLPHDNVIRGRTAVPADRCKSGGKSQGKIGAYNT